MEILKYSFVVVVNIVILLSLFIDELTPIVYFGIISYLIVILIKCIKDNQGRRSTWICRPYKKYTKKTYKSGKPIVQEEMPRDQQTTNRK